MHSLRVKLIAPFIAGTLLLTILLAGYTYTSARRAVEDAMLLISEAKTQSVANSMTLLFRSMSTSVQGMVGDQHVTALFSAGKERERVTARTTEWLNTLTKSSEFYRDIIIVDAKGVCIASTNPSHLGNSYWSALYVQRALGGMFTFGEPSVGRVTKKFTVTSAAPIDTPAGIAGALIIINDFPKIVDYEARAAHDSQTLFTSLLTPEGVFMAHKDKTVMGTKAPEFLSLYRHLVVVGEKGGAVTYSFNGVEHVGFAKVEGSSKWIVLTSGPTEAVFASAYRVGTVVLAISLGFLLAISLLVIRFSNGILHSLLSLISYAKRVSEGDLDRGLEKTTRTDELGTLHVALQSLVHSLQSMLEKTQEASKLKGEFLANMSHEIRTPLNAILGMVHLSMRDGTLPPKQLDYLKKIEVAAKSLLGVINDILDLSKVEAGMLSMEEVPFSLRTTVENILSIHQESAGVKSLSLLLEYQPNAPEFFLGDPLRIGQVLSNLLSNAIKFTKEGGVSVRCWLENKQEVQTGAADALVRISVTDSGMGIPEHVLGALFQPFMQADASITRQFGGTGLGLAISERLVRMMGGEIQVSSVLGQGTTFSFSLRLPIDRQPGASSAQALGGGAFEELQLEGKRILVAEDNAINQFIVEELLAPSGATVTLVENGLLALEAVTQGHFDLVLMDMQMPVMDGLEATRRIRLLATPAARDLPIIAVTANAMTEDRDSGFAAGMNDYLTKPIEPAELRRMLLKWLHKA